jgi:hypothetical protein
MPTQPSCQPALPPPPPAPSPQQPQPAAAAVVAAEKEEEEEEETYSTTPRDPATDPLWQDHWKPCAWPLPAPLAVTQGETLVVQGAHDDAGAWVEVARAGEVVGGLEGRLKEGPSPCACGLHPPVAVGGGEGDGQAAGFPMWRIREMNDGRR